MRAFYFKNKSKIVKKIRQHKIAFIKILKRLYLAKDMFYDEK